MRFALPYAEVMIQQASSGVEGQASNIVIKAEHIIKLQNKLYKMMAQTSGKKISEIEKDADRDYWMNSEEAKTYGLIDEIIEKAE